MLSNLRQVIEAPANAIVTVAAPVENLSVPVVAVNSDEAATAVRIVDKPSSREAVVLDINSTHPFRQKEVVDAVNQRFAGVIRFTTNDNLAVRRVHKVDTQSKFCYRPRFGSCQYSEGYVDWLIESISLDAEFLPKTRRHHHDLVVANNLSREGKTQ